MGVFVSTVLLVFVLFILCENYLHKKRVQYVLGNHAKMNCKKLVTLIGADNLDTVREAPKVFARGTWLL